MGKTLFWSERGAIACEKHAPMRGSDSWVWERWSRVSKQDAEALRSQFDETDLCETCRARNEREATADKPQEVRLSFKGLIDYWRLKYGEDRKAADIQIRAALRAYPWLRAYMPADVQAEGF